MQGCGGVAARGVFRPCAQLSAVYADGCALGEADAADPVYRCGLWGHSPLSKMRTTYRTPYVIDKTLTLENYDTTDFGYLRVIVNATTMTVEFSSGERWRDDQDAERCGDDQAGYAYCCLRLEQSCRTGSLTAGGALRAVVPLCVAASVGRLMRQMRRVSR